MNDSDRDPTPGQDLLATLECALNRARELLAGNEQLQKRVADLERDDRAELATLEEERCVLDADYQRIERENAELAERLVRIEQENSQLINLYVAGSQLHSTLELSTVVRNIVEIVINLIGAEKFVVYMYKEQSEGFVPVAAEGAEPEQFPILRVTDDTSSGALTSSEMRFADSDSKDGSRPISWIPLQMWDRPVGAIAIYRLLVQKDGFTPVDHQLFALLAESAATALFAARLYSDSERKAKTFRGFFDLLTK